MRIDPRCLWRGEVGVEIRGERGGALLDLAIAQGLRLRDLRRCGEDRLLLRVELADFYALRLLARDCHCRLRVRSRLGLPFALARCRRRPLLLAGAVFGMLALAFLSSLVSAVEITSPDPLPSEEVALVRQLAAEAGVRELRSCWGMDLEAAEQYIRDQFRQLIYAEIYRRGNRLEIRVARREDVPPEEALKPPGHIVAACPGVIRDVLVRRGTAAVAEGETVTAGQILIYGWFEGQPLAADGIVNATVYAEGRGECALSEQVFSRSGNFCQGLALRRADGETLTLLGGEQPPYALFQQEERVEQVMLWRKIPLAVEIVWSEVWELRADWQNRSPEAAWREAEARAVAQAQAAFAALNCEPGVGESDSPLLAAEELPAEDGLRRAHAVLSAPAEIGLFRPAAEGEIAEYLRQYQQELAQAPEEAAE